MKTEIAQGVVKGISYPEYRKIVTDLLAEAKSTGNEQSEELLHYSKLNETRMHRLDKTIHVTDEVMEKIHNFKVTGVVERTTCDKPYTVGSGDRKVALLDFGAKKNIAKKSTLLTCWLLSILLNKCKINGNIALDYLQRYF